jgi:Ca-activated chloride channel family protein
VKPIIFNPIINWWILLVIFLPILAGLVFLVIKSGKYRRRNWCRRIVMVLILMLIAFHPVMLGGASQKGMTLLDVYFLVDLSPSVSAEDYDGQKTRLTGIQGDIRALVTQQAGARFSLMSFDSTGRVILPLTTDASAILAGVEVLQPSITYYSSGSSIDSGLDKLLEQLENSKKSHPERKRVVFYMGDGEQTADSKVKSFSSVKYYIDGGAVLGYGTDNGGRMLENYSYDPTEYGGSIEYIKSREYDSNFKLTDALSKIDEAALRKIASEMGLDYVHRTKPDDASGLVKQISIDKIATDSYDTNSFVELYWLLAIGLVVLTVWESVGVLHEITIARHKTKGAK